MITFAKLTALFSGSPLVTPTAQPQAALPSTDISSFASAQPSLGLFSAAQSGAVQNAPTTDAATLKKVGALTTEADALIEKLDKLHADIDKARTPQDKSRADAAYAEAFHTSLPEVSKKILEANTLLKTANPNDPALPLLKRDYNTMVDNLGKYHRTERGEDYPLFHDYGVLSTNLHQSLADRGIPWPKINVK